MQMEFELAETGEREQTETTSVQSDSSTPAPSADEGVRWLEMDPTEFRAALKHVLKLARSKERAEAVISFADGQVAVAFPGLEVRSAAEGVWPGEARVSAGFIQGLARSLTATRAESGPWKFHVEGETLFFGTYSTPCVWQDAGGRSIHLPADAPFLMQLRLSWSHTEEEIERSGLTPIVEAATARMTKLVARAAKALSALEISEESVRDFVVQSVRDADPDSPKE
jgi:hypothetical protein